MGIVIKYKAMQVFSFLPSSFSVHSITLFPSFVLFMRRTETAKEKQI